ncbi:enoyl-CoA hydratase [Paraburkholderia oxyphila]|uniref:enoyl-CoA hydratase n=1 Tax=Paraburkholderia oxyphila TaxID=614212 RepID=UPI001428952E|nr:enoyl-CoA hydratase [Paraburkholderia oxyphila]
MEYETVEYEEIESVARIYLNRPEKRNAQNIRLLEELEHALAHAGADPRIRVVVLGGRGTHFSAGHDVVELGDDYLKRPVEERYSFEEARYYQSALKLWDLPKPVIAEIRGACVAGAFMLAAMCDLIVASEETYFADPVVQMGAAAVEVLFHPWALGPRLAKDILFTGRRLTVQEAGRIGLVNRIVPDSALSSTALELAQQIANAPPFSLKLIKNSIHRALDIQGFRTSLNAHFDTHQLSHAASAVPVAESLSFLKAHLHDKGRKLQ